MSLISEFFGRKKDKPAESNPKPDFSNVSGGSSTRSVPPPAAAPAPAPAPVMRTVVVAPGDSLSKIAKREYGDAAKWTRIFEANRDQITNPDLIHPGQKLKIP